MICQPCPCDQSGFIIQIKQMEFYEEYFNDVRSLVNNRDTVDWNDENRLKISRFLMFFMEDVMGPLERMHLLTWIYYYVDKNDPATLETVGKVNKELSKQPDEQNIPSLNYNIFHVIRMQLVWSKNLAKEVARAFNDFGFLDKVVKYVNNGGANISRWG
jgi:hypothetical protein